MSNKAKNIEETISEANLCYRCRKCAVVCPVAPTGNFNPRKLIFEINYVNPIRERMGVEHAFTTPQENVWYCLTCGRCVSVCPQEINIIDIVRKMRQEIRDSLPEDDRFVASSTHLDIFPTAFNLMLKNKQAPQKREILKSVVQERNWAPIKFKEKGALAIFTGSLNLYEHALYELEFPQFMSIYSAIRLLNLADIEPVVANDYIAGHDAYWSGDFDTFEELMNRNVKIWKEAGIETILVADAEEFRTLSVDYPKNLTPEKFPFKVVWLPDFIVENEIFEKVRNRKIAFPKKVTVHDPCRISRLVEGEHYESVRTILNQMPHLELVELNHNRGDARCCGVSTFRNCNDFSRHLTKKRIQEAINVDADYMVTTCPKCICHFSCFLREFKGLELEEGVKAPVIIDLFTLLGLVYDLTNTRIPVPEPEIVGK